MASESEHKSTALVTESRWVISEDFRSVTRFRADCLRELEKTKRAWPNLDYSTVAGALVLSSSPPRIAPSPLRLVDAE